MGTFENTSNLASNVSIDDSELQQLMDESIQRYMNNRAVNSVQLVAALASLCTNSLTVYGVSSSSLLRAKSFYILVANLAVADAGLAAAYVYVTTRRCYDDLAGLGNLRTERECLPDVVPLMLGIVGSILFTLATCFDRAFAVLVPHRYSRKRAGYPWPVVPVAWACALVDVTALSLTLDTPNRITTMCTIVEVAGDSYTVWNLVSTLLYSCLAMIFSAACAIRIWLLIQRRGPGTSSQELLDSVRSVLIVGSLVFCTQVATRVGLLYIVKLPRSQRSAYSSLARLPQLLCGAANFWVHLTRSGVFRREVLARLGVANGCSNSVAAT